MWVIKINTILNKATNMSVQEKVSTQIPFLCHRNCFLSPLPEHYSFLPTSPLSGNFTNIELVPGNVEQKTLVPTTTLPYPHGSGLA